MTQVHKQNEQDRLFSCGSEHIVSTNLTDTQKEHSGFSSRLSMYSPEQECHTSTTMIRSTTPAPEQTMLMSAEEFYL